MPRGSKPEPRPPPAVAPLLEVRCSEPPASLAAGVLKSSSAVVMLPAA